MANDLNTEIKIGADATGVEAGVSKAKRSLASLGAEAIKASREAAKGVEGVGDGGEKAAKKIEGATRRVVGEIQRQITAFEAGEKGTRAYQESMAKLRGIDPNVLKPLLDRLDESKQKAESAATANTKLAASYSGMSTSTESWASSLRGVGAAAAGIAAIAATAGMAAKSMFDASASAERLRTMLDFSTGGNSAKEIEYLRAVTYRLGLEFSSTAKAYGQFQAAAKGTTLEGDKARAVFESVAKASAVMGLSAADTSGVLLALQQMISKGTVQAEELRGQLGERLPGAFQIAAKAMGVTTAELGKMLEQGQVVADDFLPKFGKALEENLGGAAEKAAQRLDAAVNRFDTAWEKLKQKAGDSGVSKAVAGELGAITRDLDAVTDGMDRASMAGGGMWAQLGAAGAIGAGRVGFSTLNLAANTLNGTINALTGGVFGLRTDLALLPDIFKTDAEYAASLGQKLASAEAEMAALQARGDSQNPNFYIRNSFFQLQEYIKELKKAQSEQTKLTGGKAPNPNMNAGVTESGRAREAYNTQRAKDQASSDALRLKVSGVPDSYVKEMSEVIRLNQAGVLVGKEYTEVLKKMQDELLKKTGVTKGSAAAANAEQNTYESLIASIRAKIEEDKLELAGGAALTESQRLRIKLDQDLLSGKIKLGSAREAEVRGLIEEKAASEAQVTARRALNKANIEAGQTREKYLASLETGIGKIRDDIAAQQEATARMGLSKEAIADLDAAKLEMLATDLELQAIKAMDRNLDQATYDALKEQAKLYRDLAAAKKGGAAKETALDLEKANKDAAKKAQEEWGRAAEDINRSLTDALLRGFESGKDFAKNLRDTVVNMFKTLVLRPIISAIVSPVAGAVTGALGLAAPAAAAATGGSALGTVGNLASGAGMLGSLGSGFANGLSAWGSGGSVTGVLSNPGLYTGAELAGALAPIALGIGALVAISKATKGETRTGGQFGVAFDGAVTNQRRDQTYTVEGQQFDRDFTNGLQTALRDGLTYRLEGDPVAQESAIKAAVSGTASGINGILKALGSEARLAGFSAGLETSGKDRGGVFAGGMFADGRAFGESGKGDNYQGTLYEKFSTNSPDFKAALENFTLDLKQSTIQALQTVTDIPKSVKSLLDGVDAEGLADDAANALLEAINAQILGVDQLKQAFATIGFDKLAALSFDAASGLAAASGGFDKLIANLDTYYSNFFSADEQRAQIQKNLQQSFASLNLPLPDIDAKDARAQFRARVESASGDLSETGQKTYAALLQLSGSFAQITPEAAAVVQAVGSVSQAMQRLTGDSASLQIDLLRAQGNTTGADAAQRTLDTAGLSDAEIAVYDYNASLRAQIVTLDAATQAAQEQAEIRTGFERQLLELNGDTAALRALDIAGMDAYNVALYDQVQALGAAAQQMQALRASLIGLESGFAGGGFARQYRAQDAAGTVAGLLSGVGIQKDVGMLAQQMLSATSGEVEAYFREIWNVLDTDEARQKLVDVTSVMLDLAQGAGSVAEAYQKQQAELQALAQDAARLFSARNTAGNLTDTISGAMGGKGTFGAQRESELWDALSKTSNYEKQVELAGQLTDMVISRQQLEVQNAERMLDFGRNLRGYVDGLKLGSLSPLTNAEKLAEASSQYNEMLGKAQGGDTSAQAGLQGIASTYLDLARTYFAGNEQFGSIFGSVTSSLEALGVSSMSEAQQQLSLGTQSLGELQRLYSITETAYGSLNAQYETAVGELAAAQDALVLQSDSLDQLKDIAGLLSGLPAEIAVRLPAINTESATYLPPAMPVQQGAQGDNTALIAELQALRKEVADLRAENRQDAQMVAVATVASASASASQIADATAKAAHTNAVKQGAVLV